MGTTISDVNFSLDHLESEAVKGQDNLILRYDEEKLFAEKFPYLYSLALCNGVIHRKTDRRAYDKMNSRRRKIVDVSQIFNCANITDIQSMYVLYVAVRFCVYRLYPISVHFHSLNPLKIRNGITLSNDPFDI